MSINLQSSDASDKLKAACELSDFGIQLMRQNIRRALPTASEEVINRELNRWLFDQPADFTPTDE